VFLLQSDGVQNLEKRA